MMLEWVALKTANPQPLTSRTATESSFAPGLLACFLGSNHGVSDATKEKIAKFIETKGLAIHPPGYWISNTPNGAGKWMAAVARMGLHADTNRIRKWSSRLLASAGIPHDEPELLPAPSFRVRLNGEPWFGDIKTDSYLDMSVDYICRSSCAGWKPGRRECFPLGSQWQPDLFSYGADSFLAADKISKVIIYHLPGPWPSLFGPGLRRLSPCL